MKILLSFFIVLIFTHFSNGCSSPEIGVPVCASFTRADVVFLGKALKAENLSGKDDYADGWRKVRFQVLENFKGADNPTFSVTTPDGKSAGGLNIKSGQTWIIFARMDTDGKAFYGFRGEKYDAQENSDELETLKNAAAGKTDGSISGRLETKDQNGKYLYEEAEVTVEGGGQRLTSKTDAAGFFNLSPLPAGKYKVEIKFPYRADLVWSEYLLKTSLSAGLPTVFKYELELRAGDCEYSFFEVSKKEQ